MKYLLTESRLNEVISKFIRERYPLVYDVQFDNVKVSLGSTKGIPSIDRTDIIIILDNRDDSIPTTKLKSMGINIIDDVDKFFGLGYRNYGSEWGFVLKVLYIPIL